MATLRKVEALILLVVMMVMVVVVVGVVEAIEEDSKEDQGPKTSAWRQQPSAAGVKTSYDLSEAYNVMAANRMGVGSGFNNAASSRLAGDRKSNRDGYSGSLDTVDAASNYYDSYGQGMGYGSYASESGYGLSCASGYVNASAVALLAFLFLLNIVQDVVQQITGTRKKRSAEEDDRDDVFAFVGNGGLAAMKDGLPQVVLPLMIDLLDASEEPQECLQRPLCEANAELSTRFGVAGRVVGSLLSNVVSKAFSGDHTPKFHLGLEASSAGRKGHDCSVKFRKCSRGHNYSKEANESRNESLYENNHSQQENRPLDNIVS